MEEEEIILVPLSRDDIEFLMSDVYGYKVYDKLEDCLEGKEGLCKEEIEMSIIPMMEDDLEPWDDVDIAVLEKLKRWIQ